MGALNHVVSAQPASGEGAVTVVQTATMAVEAEGKIETCGVDSQQLRPTVQNAHIKPKPILEARQTDSGEEISYNRSFDLSQIASSAGSKASQRLEDDGSGHGQSISRSPMRSPPPAPRGHSVDKDHAIMERWK